MTPIKIDIKQDGDWQRIVYKGPINEESKAVLNDIMGKLGPRCILDLEGVSFLNSSGIRDWSYFVRSAKVGRELVYDRCPDEVVRSMNMVLSFAADLDVKSVLRSYICPSCEYEQIEHLSLGKDYMRGSRPARKNVLCQSCRSVMEPLEGDEEFYLFLGGDLAPP